MQSSTGLHASFSPGGDAFVIASADGRVRTYDTGTGRLRATLGPGDSSANGSNASASSGLLTERHTCLSWLARRKDKSAKKQGGSIGRQLVLGTAAGDVKVFDAQMGELKWRSRNVIEGGVSAVAFTQASDGLIYATGADRQVVALNAATGEVVSRFDASKHAVSCLVVAEDNVTALCGGSGLALWDLASKERKAKFTGHMTPTSSAVFTPDGRHAVSAAPGERQVAVWSTTAPKKPKRAQPAVASLSLEDPAVQLDTCGCGERDDEEGGGGAFHVAAVSISGEAYVWRCHERGEGAGVETRLLARIRVGAAPTKGTVAGAEEGIMAVKLQAGLTGPSLLVARGSSAKPVFEKVGVPDSGVSPTDGVAAVISLQPASGGDLFEGHVPGKDASKTKLQHTRQDVTVLGAENLGQPVLMRLGGAVNAAAVARKRAAEPDLAAAGVLTVAEMEDDEVPDLPEDELPLGQRVANLEQRANMAGDAVPEDEEAGTSGHQHLPEGSSKTDSLAVLLTQALRSNDRALLEKCLATSNQRVISNTVRRLIPMDAALFLRAAVDRVLSKPARAGQLAPWIKAIMHFHTGYLMTAPGVQGPLTALYQAIDSRVSLYQQLLKVYGRLNLITAHTNLRSSTAEANGDGDAADGDDGVPAPEVVFEDGSDEEPEAEDPFALEADDNDDDEDDDDLDDLEEGEGFDDAGADDMSEDEDGDEDDDDDDDEE